jgi:hypothetical protein
MGCSSLGIERLSVRFCLLLLLNSVHRLLSWARSSVNWVLVGGIVSGFLQRGGNHAAGGTSGGDVVDSTKNGLAGVQVPDSKLVSAPQLRNLSLTYSKLRLILFLDAAWAAARLASND